jgi:hypothetical protein
MLGTALVDNLLGLIVVAVLVTYFYVCGSIGERNLTATFSTAYPQDKSTTEMLIRLARVLAGIPLIGTRTRSGGCSRRCRSSRSAQSACSRTVVVIQADRQVLPQLAAGGHVPQPTARGRRMVLTARGVP